MYVPPPELGLSHPLSRQQVCPSSLTEGGGHTRLRVRGRGSPDSDDWRKSLALCLLCGRVSTEVTFWHSAVYRSDFRRNSGEIPRNSAEFRGISPELRRNHYRSPKIPRNSVSAEFRGHPTLWSNLEFKGIDRPFGGGGQE